jgi:hypothetical protein
MMAKQSLGSAEINGSGLNGRAGLPPDFLWHLQQRMGVDELTAAETLQLWLSSYEPGPTALARVHLETDG